MGTLYIVKHPGGKYDRFSEWLSPESAIIERNRQNLFKRPGHKAYEVLDNGSKKET